MDRRSCKGEEDARSTQCAAKASAGISTLLDPRKSNCETQIPRIPCLASSPWEVLVAAVSLGSPVETVCRINLSHKEWAGKFYQLLSKHFLCSPEMLQTSTSQLSSLEVHRV